MFHLCSTNMKPTYHYIIRADKTNKEGLAPIYMRITFDRRKSLYNTGIKVLPKHWNPEARTIRKSHPKAKVLNLQLEELILNAMQIGFDLEKNNKLSSKLIVDKLKGKAPELFIDYAEGYCERVKSDGLVRRAKQVKVALNKIRSFSSKKLYFRDIDQVFLDNLKKYQVDTYKNISTTVRKDFAKIKLVFDDAIEKGIIAESPFDRYKMPKVQKSKKEALSFEQLKSIEALELDSDSSLFHTRNYFLFSFYNAGIRFGDLCRLTWENIQDGRLKYQMSKTARNNDPKWKDIKLNDHSFDILKQYRTNGSDTDLIFPLLDADKELNDPVVFDKEKASKNAIVNIHLKKIAKKAGIDTKVSFHMARHSFARHAASQGMNIYAISNALAHSDLKTTQVYLKSFDENLLDKEMENLF